MGMALYRKHRSRSLDDVVGQKHITDTLKSALKKGAISHAYLFTGPKGVGKTSIARILAHEINGLDYDDESIHLDIIEIDAASNRRIDEIRDLRDKVRIAPTSAKYKVYIIDEVHMLTREAFNALLKTLEEPPKHAIFILATTEIHKVPETIISRTQRYTFRPISDQDAVKHLKFIAGQEKIKITDEAIELIARHGNGSFRDSISILDQLSGLDSKLIDIDEVTLLLGLPDKEIIDKIIQSVANNDSTKLFTSIGQLKERGVGSTQAALAISASLRDNIIKGNSNFSHSKSVKILRGLLPLTLNSNDFMGLELCLLDNMEIDKPPKPINNLINSPAKPETKVIETKKTIKSEKKESPGTKKKEKSIKKQKPIIDLSKIETLDKNTWNELLDDLKGKHNTLYGVLRMARPTLSDGQICIEFNFGFHKKRVDEPYNNAKIKELMTKHFGTGDFISTIKPKESKENNSKKRPTKKDDEAVKNISNIFKGAELLES